VGVCVGVGVNVGVSVDTDGVAEGTAVTEAVCVEGITAKLEGVFGRPFSSTLALEHPPRKIIITINNNKARCISKRSRKVGCLPINLD
jgi:hypothetical protein